MLISRGIYASYRIPFLIHSQGYITPNKIVENGASAFFKHM